jgi:CheY-like chemotaxis protein
VTDGSRTRSPGAPVDDAASVLIVDDNADSLRALEALLEPLGARVVTAGSGRDAIRLLESEQFAVVLLDVQMPGMDGFEVSASIRSQDHNRSIPIIFLTGMSTTPEHVFRGYEAGAVDYIVKPFDPGELQARIAVGIRVLSLQEKLAHRVSELQTALANVKQLRGLLPICSYCKRIRGDDQYWQQVEGYISEHSDAQFSHGICPACFETLAAELDDETRERLRLNGR